MAYPPQADVENALEQELRRRGEPTRAMHLYEPLADHFGLTDTERAQPRHDGQPGTEWGNRVQWARRGLVKRRVMAYRPYQPWALAEWDL
jgi:5-methylcytosine-specific restriction enzyme A